MTKEFTTIFSYICVFNIDILLLLLLDHMFLFIKGINDIFLKKTQQIEFYCHERITDGIIYYLLLNA